jgi:hypothetical protein
MAEVYQVRLDENCRGDDLNRLSVYFLEPRPQRVVPAENFIQALIDQADAYRTFKQHRLKDIVGRVWAINLV